MKRYAYSSLELIVVISIITIVFGLFLPAIQKVRSAAGQIKCINNLKQIAIASHVYHDTFHQFPPALQTPVPGDYHYHLSWLGRLLPYLEQQSAWERSESDYRTNPFPFSSPRHFLISHTILGYTCPADQDSSIVWPYTSSLNVTFTSYLGNSGSNYLAHDGVIFKNSRVKIEHIQDGSSETLLAGERLTSPEKRFGWWYAANGQDGGGSLDYVLGTQEKNVVKEAWYQRCGPGPFEYKKQKFDDYCSTFQYWSLHPNGANFAFCDGSARFLSYSANSILVSLSSRSGGEIVTMPGN